MILKLEIAKIHLLSGNGEQIRKRIATDHAKHTTVYFISHPAKVVPCPVYPVKVRPLAGLAERKSSSPDGCGIFFRQTSLQKCLERLKSWEENPDHPCEISLYYDHAPYSFGFTQCYPDGRTGIVGGLLYHGIPDRSFAVTLQPFHGWQIHT